jgi:hypothetical protein
MAKSIVAGLRTHETAESMKRFESGVRGILRTLNAP